MAALQPVFNDSGSVNLVAIKAGKGLLADWGAISFLALPCAKRRTGTNTLTKRMKMVRFFIVLFYTSFFSSS